MSHPISILLSKVKQTIIQIFIHVFECSMYQFFKKKGYFNGLRHVGSAKIAKQYDVAE